MNDPLPGAEPLPLPFPPVVLGIAIVEGLSIRPSAPHADLVLDGTGSLDWKMERVMSERRARGLMRGFPK